MQKSIFVKNKLLTNFINKKDPILKEEFHTNYKKYRNLLSTLMKKSKQAYYDKYFEKNWNNIKNTWKGIKSLISLKTKACSVPTVLSSENGDTITNTYDIANNSFKIDNIIVKAISSIFNVYVLYGSHFIKLHSQISVFLRVLFLIKDQL